MPLNIYERVVIWKYTNKNPLHLVHVNIFPCYSLDNPGWRLCVCIDLSTLQYVQRCFCFKKMRKMYSTKRQITRALRARPFKMCQLYCQKERQSMFFLSRLSCSRVGCFGRDQNQSLLLRNYGTPSLLTIVCQCLIKNVR